jgi:hypothetical protein
MLVTTSLFIPPLSGAFAYTGTFPYIYDQICSENIQGEQVSHLIRDTCLASWISPRKLLSKTDPEGLAIYPRFFNGAFAITAQANLFSIKENEVASQLTGLFIYLFSHVECVHK